MTKITIKDLTFSYGNHKILDQISISVNDSEMLSLVGPNGSGKTTLGAYKVHSRWVHEYAMLIDIEIYVTKLVNILLVYCFRI